MKLQAFTRIELIVTLAAIGLLGIIGASVHGNTRERSERLVCMNNQRLIGRAFNMWAAEHNGQIPGRVPQSEGGLTDAIIPHKVPGIGTFPAAFAGNTWFQFLWVYEDLPSASILVCPSDPARKRASGFTATPGGFAHVTMQNSALSYLFSTHGLRELPSMMLSADRNVITAGTTGCSSTYTTTRLIRIGSQAVPTGWTSGLHVNSGNVLMTDGRVEEMTTPDFNKYVNSFGESGGDIAFHLLIP
jgi:prepilin-type processing-associated H-X9-DG protein